MGALCFAVEPPSRPGSRPGGPIYRPETLPQVREFSCGSCIPPYYNSLRQGCRPVPTPGIL